jgi:2-polyprenyl-6-methoxyphenol hydroxylase-like FAD-dependent oxidoreductase
VQIVVVGAGIGGLTAAIGLARRGHVVTVVERDDTPMPNDVEGAFAWERKGAPQVRHTHGFPALIRATLRDRFPDVLDALRAAGVGEVSILPESVTPDSPTYARDAEDLQVLSARRTTLEWVLRRCALAQDGVSLETGAAVEGLDDPRLAEADVVVAATGRRDNVPGWFAARGITILEEEHPTGTIYLSRFYRAGDDAPMGYRGGRRAGIGFVLAGADNGTYSATLAIPADDAELRAHLLDEANFEAALPLFREMAPVVARQGEPITDAQTMGGLINRRRRFVDDAGEPLTPGFFAVGDAHTCTNPVYGRGSSLAVLQAVLVADALDAHPDDVVAASRAYEAASEARIRPWYEMSLMTDKPEAADFSGFDLQSMRRAAGSTDPEIATLMTKMMSLLITPQEAFGDPAIVERLNAAAAPKQRPRDPSYKPLTREDILSVRG